MEMRETARGNNKRCVEGSIRSRGEAGLTSETEASNAADDYIARCDRAAELAWDCEIEW